MLDKSGVNDHGDHMFDVSSFFVGSPVGSHENHDLPGSIDVHGSNAVLWIPEIPDQPMSNGSLFNHLFTHDPIHD